MKYKVGDKYGNIFEVKEIPILNVEKVLEFLNQEERTSEELAEEFQISKEFAQQIINKYKEKKEYDREEFRIEELY